MTDYQIQPLTRVCSATGRELRPGEVVYSVLADEAGRFVRKDFAADAWSGPPAGSFGYWRSQVPVSDTNHRPPIDDELLLECLHRLDGVIDSDKVKFRYVVALLLMRRKRLRFEDVINEPSGEILILRCIRTGEQFRVTDAGLTAGEIDSVQEEVFRVLGWR